MPTLLFTTLLTHHTLPPTERLAKLTGISIQPSFINWTRTGDLAEVCTAAAILYDTDAQLLSGDILAIITKRLVTHETKPGGPYTNTKREVDVATNAAVAYLFTTLGTTLPNVAQYLATVKPRDFTSSQHPSVRLIHQLYKKRTPSQKVTTQSFSADIYAHADELVYDSPLYPALSQAIKHIQQADKTNEVACISSYFAAALGSTTASATLLRDLGAANILCWVAYSLYDDVLDEELGAHVHLPTANSALTWALDLLFHHFPGQRQTILTTIDTMNQANQWELEYCRARVQDGQLHVDSFPRYQRRSLLAKRALGHILGPLLLAHHLGLSSAAQKTLRRGFHHYLIARQLSDDLHDWTADLQQGHLSPVVTSLLRRARCPSGAYQLDALLPRLRRQFIQRELARTNTFIRQHCRIALHAFSSAGLHAGDLTQLVTRLSESTQAAEKEKQQFHTFLNTYISESTASTTSRPS